jgi:phospholipase C
MDDTLDDAIEHVFVLMLENHSFDNVLAFSGIPGIHHATSADSNRYDGVTFKVGPPGAPAAMPTDPGHEAADVAEQLTGRADALQPWQPYPTDLDDSGYVQNYATTKSEITTGNPRLPYPSERGYVMKCFNTPKQLLVLQALASNFVVCDAWYASVPGPTWPNRFFLHGASSGGWGDSPSMEVIKDWITSGNKFRYPSGASVFDRLAEKGLQWRIYSDTEGSPYGAVPLVAAIEGVAYPADTHPFTQLASDLAHPYPYAYTFIEPNYGDVISGSYEGGSSQHPLDGMARGEALIKATYLAIRNSSLWEKSLLVILYDEHGGFYDSATPGTAPVPADGSPENLMINSQGLRFDHYGPRVPALVISPWVPAGVVDHTVYDHTSVLATIERLFHLQPLTDRDGSANDVRHLLGDVPRDNCPVALPEPVADPPRAAGNAVVEDGDDPLPAVGNVHGTLAILALADLEGRAEPAERQAIRDELAAMRTRADARSYSDAALDRVAR